MSDRSELLRPLVDALAAELDKTEPDLNVVRDVAREVWMHAGEHAGPPQIVERGEVPHDVMDDALRAAIGILDAQGWERRGVLMIVHARIDGSDRRTLATTIANPFNVLADILKHHGPAARRRRRSL